MVTVTKSQIGYQLNLRNEKGEINGKNK